MMAPNNHPPFQDTEKNDDDNIMMTRSISMEEEEEEEDRTNGTTTHHHHSPDDTTNTPRERRFSIRSSEDCGISIEARSIMSTFTIHKQSLYTGYEVGSGSGDGISGDGLGGDHIEQGQQQRSSSSCDGSIEKNMKRVEQETKTLSKLRFMLLYFIGFVATLSTVGIYYFTFTNEKQSYESSYYANSNKVLSSIQEEMDHNMEALYSFSTILTLKGVDENIT
jgi:hypothetical protein